MPINVVSNVESYRRIVSSNRNDGVPGDDVEVWSVTQNAWVAGAVQAHDRQSFKSRQRFQVYKEKTKHAVFQCAYLYFSVFFRFPVV